MLISASGVHHVHPTARPSPPRLSNRSIEFRIPKRRCRAPLAEELLTLGSARSSSLLRTEPSGAVCDGCRHAGPSDDRNLIVAYHRCLTSRRLLVRFRGIRRRFDFCYAADRGRIARRKGVLDGLVDVLFALVAVRMLLGSLDAHDGLR